MPSMTEPRQPLLGPWPPENWRRDVEIEDRFPVVSLRRDIVMVLKSRCGEVLPWVLPAMTPAEVLGTLNLVGPTLGERALPMIEAVLEALYSEGRIGRVPPVTVGQVASYVARDAAEKDLPRGKPVMLLPRRGGADRPFAAPKHLDLGNDGASDERTPSHGS